MEKSSSIQTLIFFLILIPGAWAAWTFSGRDLTTIFWVVLWIAIIAVIVASSFKVADQWEKAVVLRLGKYDSLKGPGPFFIIPVVDRVAYWIDLRIITTTFMAEKTLTKDTVPVDVEAVLFWKVVDSEKAALAVENYRTAISWASQTALREVIGKSMLADMLENREKLDKELQGIIDLRTEQWGVNIKSVEIRDILIPTELQNAMSMQAQAERERQARVILGDSEKQIAQKFEEAAKTYQDNPTALHLRAMNMLFEGLKTGNPTLVIVPASVLSTMNLGDTTGVVALAQNLEDRREKEKLSKKVMKEQGGGGFPPMP
ncbi:MAG TPA: slipin family protein [Methanomicrobiales archaeon]|jgi:regulator of protease activity HflC (stomatin/prohibitin superfamily)|nr:slipin family protein [Methanomicrobiales archaeon]